MSTKEEPPASLPKLMTLNRGFKLAEQWVKNMPGDEEAEETEVEARPARLGLGAKVPRKSQVEPIYDPVERRLHKKFGAGRKKPAGDEDSIPPPNNEEDNGDEDDDENLDSRTNSFAKKRPAFPPTTPQSKKKHK
ncbi:uncharacterized protein LOC110737153 [Chenopodium quinoa]|uniref:uncharacterized protein LOC110737153 n=1 Tax=Chenopodium quinoa TaxID=63459 RepID=UPI000B76D585|nr:uncharacterized protein LOC110737153 [Chenopodium quinoa]XP_021773219.1 uncharacterized protein LOC110737153 [Chenopodium quinoa]XP_021773220.1 uncharacterized protein LOC110737153 [Chenopodium quinoa]XP_021773221.1 uncharacterized protein LOC110737153 [Chenopodium quinoa]XP_021773222.1 uncharacterized protein LOC110737153 [Chenopodium quinoa]